MLFSSSIFLFCFLPAVTSVYFILNRHLKAQNAFLFLVSLFFYAWGEPVFVLIMMFSIASNYCFGLLIERKQTEQKKKAALAAALIINLSILFVFKYFSFTVKSINSLIRSDISVAQIALPIGISFFTFQAISYIIDVYRGNGKAQKNIVDLGLYISLFPQLIAGPIVRYETIAAEINVRKTTLDDFSAGVSRFVIGLSKKIIISNTVALVADSIFDSDSASLSFASAWLGAIAYTLQIYFDFSGYSDMAIGLGRIFGFHFLENFDYPYSSLSITEFWRRWHISLGTWFRDYVYFPLGGSRVKSKLLLIRNLFVVWLLTGIWHGANWTFILWGLMYFVLLTFEKLTGLGKSSKRFVIPRYIYTMLFVVIGWVLFRSNSVGDAVGYLGVMFGLSGQPLADSSVLSLLMPNIAIFAAGVILSFPLAKKLFNKLLPSGAVRTVVVALGVSILAVICFSFVVMGNYNPFIYFNF